MSRLFARLFGAARRPCARRATLQLQQLDNRELPSAALPVGSPLDLTPRQGHVMGYDAATAGSVQGPGQNIIVFIIEVTPHLTPRQGHVMDYDTLTTPGASNFRPAFFDVFVGDESANIAPPTGRILSGSSN